jgi:uncharacterized protein YkwD
LGCGLAGALFVSLLSSAPAGAIGGFGDVPAGAFFAAPVQWMVDSGITSGTGPGCFSPDATTTRGEVATFIHRWLGQPASGGEPFVDVGDGDFFHDAVAWMYGAGVTGGTTPTTFEPHDPVTRGELAAFLHRVENEPTGYSEPFVDVGDQHFFRDAVAWMVDTGATSGTTPFTFEPYRSVTRGEIAAFLYRLSGEPSVVLGSDGVCDPSGLHADLAEAEAHSLDLLNDLRRGLGLGPVVRDATMDAFARDWSRVMDDTDDFRHSGGPWAENIAWWSAGWMAPDAAADRLHDLWVDSAGHYANMTNPSRTHVGIGFWRGDDGWHATHVFS